VILLRFLVPRLEPLNATLTPNLTSLESDCDFGTPMFTPALRLQNIRKSATRVLFDSAPPGSINLGLGEPDFPTPDVVRREAIRVIEQDRIGYTTNAGIPALREKIADYHKRRAVFPFTADSVCVTTGAEEAFSPR